MTKTLVVAADLGACKFYRLDWTPVRRTPRLKLIQSFNLVDAPGRILDKVTDEAGRHRVPMSRMSASYAERQKLPAELKRRLIKQIAEQINSACRDEGCEAIYLAADKEILHRVLSHLEPAVRAR